MPGKNIILTPGQILFEKGDASNGMYLVRKGELIVYLEEKDREVTLASVNDGGMIGEMALFDNQPRSASVKANSPTEVTLISTEDFKKLMKQIPKWFTVLMSTLSGRLRSTNERLQMMESKANPGLKKIMVIQRILHVIDLLWHKEGEKTNKEWHLEVQPMVQALVNIFHEQPEVILGLLKALIQHNMYGEKLNSYKNPVLTTNTRGHMSRFLAFYDRFVSINPPGPLPQSAMELLHVFQDLGEKAGYETFNASLPELEGIGKKAGYASVQNWKNDYSLLVDIHDDLKILKVAGHPPALRCNKKAMKEIIRFHRLISHLANIFP